MTSHWQDEKFKTDKNAATVEMTIESLIINETEVVMEVVMVNGKKCHMVTYAGGFEEGAYFVFTVDPTPWPE